MLISGTIGESICATNQLLVIRVRLNERQSPSRLLGELVSGDKPSTLVVKVRKKEKPAFQHSRSQVSLQVDA